jgi:hypothetical protein
MRAKRGKRAKKVDGSFSLFMNDVKNGCLRTLGKENLPSFEDYLGR